MNTPLLQPVLEVHDLCVGYKNRTVLHDLSFACLPGQFISLLGPNGAGKTTLLRTLSRHLPPKAGQVLIQGKPLAHIPALELARTMAVVLTTKISPPLFTVFEFVAIGRYPHTDSLGRLSSRDEAVVAGSLGAVHALDLVDRPFANLSDGERQKVLMARALAQEPRILLLDEPTIHLDLKHRVEVMVILRDLCRAKGITVIASLHDVEIAAKVSDRVALIRDGVLSAWGAPETVLNGKTVNVLYEFDKAEFSSQLGSIELRSPGSRGRAFVVGGMGTGSLVYRMLAKKDFAITTGVLHDGDLDCFVARTLGAQCISVNPREEGEQAAADRARALLADCDLVIDSGFPLNRAATANIALLQSALDHHQPVFCLRDTPPPGLMVNGNHGFLSCVNTARLVEILEAPSTQPSSAL